MIKEAYVSFKVAKLLKEKGFDEECRSYFIDSGDNIMYRACSIKYSQCFSFDLLRPTHQMAMAWLREVYKICITIGFGNGFTTDTCFYVCIVKMEVGAKHLSETMRFYTYEDAVEAALKYSLENLI